MATATVRYRIGIAEGTVTCKTGYVKLSEGHKFASSVSHGFMRTDVKRSKLPALSFTLFVRAL
jgi:hypothetical protein